MLSNDGSVKLVTGNAENCTGTVEVGADSDTLNNTCPNPTVEPGEIVTPVNKVVRSDASNVCPGGPTLIVGPKSELPAKIYGEDVFVVAPVSERSHDATFLYAVLRTRNLAYKSTERKSE